MSPVAHSVKASLLAAFRYLLKPLVRLALKNAVSYPEFTNSLKQAYVDVASRELRSTGKPATAEGIFVIANIETAEVVNILRGGPPPDVDFVENQTPVPRVLNAWHTDTKYTGPYGVLRDLEFIRSKEPGASEVASFSDLVNAYCPGISPKALLDELLRTGCVQQVGTGVYRAVTRSYVPDALSIDNLRYFARVVQHICETLEHNLRPEALRPESIPNALLERTVWTRNGLSVAVFKKFDAHLRGRAQIFANDIDDWLTDHQEKEPNERTMKTGVGFYHYVVNEEDDRDFSRELHTNEGD